MKLCSVATVSFRFKNIFSKKESYEHLVKFLTDKKWLDVILDGDIVLAQKSSDDDGVCEVYSQVRCPIMKFWKIL